MTVFSLDYSTFDLYFDTEIALYTCFSGLLPLIKFLMVNTLIKINYNLKE